MNNYAKIKEIFESIQGEGLYIGTKQLFIRFCSCNLNCNYCDTEFEANKSYKEYTTQELISYINEKYDLNTIKFISLTGGEPLLWGDFLIEFLPKLNTRFYLETNGTITKNLDKVLPYIDVISADIKLPSCSGLTNSFELHRKFFNTIKHYKIDCAITKQYDCEGKKLFAKIVFDSNLTEEEILECTLLAKEYNLELILQPRMNNNNLAVDKNFIINTFNNFLTKYKNVRLIPQVHKFIDVE